jgi:hypothetical protein
MEVKHTDTHTQTQTQTDNGNRHQSMKSFQRVRAALPAATPHSALQHLSAPALRSKTHSRTTAQQAQAGAGKKRFLCAAVEAIKTTCGYIQSLADDINKSGVHHSVAIGTSFGAIIDEAQRVLHAPIGLGKFERNDEKSGSSLWQLFGELLRSYVRVLLVDLSNLRVV